MLDNTDAQFMTNRTEIITENPFTDLSPLEIVRRNIETQRFENIPLSLVLTEKALIDETHADELGTSMSQKRGQITPIAVRAREVQGNMVYDVIDGFHRSAGKKRRGEETIFATVVYGCSDEEMYDLRILAASSVKSVQFPRIAEWISKTWQTSKWAERTGLTVSQAFGIAVNDRETSYKAKLDGEELGQLKDWVRAKCSRWGKSVAATASILRIVEDADPTLVREVRDSGGGKDRKGKITPARLKEVVTAFPGKEFYLAQRAILAFVVDKRLYTRETEMLVDMISHTIRPDMDEVAIKELLSSINVANLIKQAAGLDTQEEEPNKTEVLEDSEEPDDDDLRALEQESINNISLDLIPTANGKKPVSNKVNHGAGRKVTSFSGDKDDLEVLKARVADLEGALAKANSTLQESNGLAAVSDWWATAPYLTPIERASMRKVFGEYTDLVTIQDKYEIPVTQIILLIQSAFAKRSIHHEDQKIRAEIRSTSD